jgi:taspase, threonine aspartase, 1
LVAQGATDFAFDIGIPVVPHDILVSPAARERWQRWRQDLLTAQAKEEQGSGYGHDIMHDLYTFNVSEEQTRQRMRAEHTRNMMLDSKWAPSQPTPQRMSISDSQSSKSLRALTVSVADSPQSSPAILPSPSQGPLPANYWQRMKSLSGRGGPRAPKYEKSESVEHWDGEDEVMTDIDDLTGMDDEKSMTGDRHGNDGLSNLSKESLVLPSASPSPPPFAALHTPLPESLPDSPQDDVLDAPISTSRPPQWPLTLETGGMLSAEMTDLHMSDDLNDNIQNLHLAKDRGEDFITDTVGAIAIDSKGRIAAGSSSGGIGMKHRGRVGPAALVGVGTAVSPAQSDDKDGTVVAAVTSGTGEHMASTQIAQKCCERLYAVGQLSRRVSPLVGKWQDEDEDQAMRNTVERDFMGMDT